MRPRPSFRRVIRRSAPRRTFALVAFVVAWAIAFAQGSIDARAARENAPLASNTGDRGSPGGSAAGGDDDVRAGAGDGGDAPSVDARPGPQIARGPERPRMRDRACSFRLPICVHGDHVPSRVLLGALASAESAWDLVTGPLAFPAPDPDLETRAYDVYLVGPADHGRTPSQNVGLDDGLDAMTWISARDVRSRIDRASAYTFVDRRLTGCALDTAIAREIARAALFRAAPATDEGSARAATSYIARLVVPCAMSALDGIDTFAARPDRAIVDTLRDLPPQTGIAYDRGASLFYWWIDASFSAEPGALVRAVWSLSPTMTPLGALRWNNEPDGFDVLRTTFKNALTTGSTLDDLFLEFAAARAFLGTPDDGAHLAEARPLGDAIRPPLDWEIDWPASPRRLASPRSIAPTGASYVAIRHAGAPPHARLRLEATWEEHAKMRWAVITRDAAGHELTRVLVPTTPRATEAQATIVDLDHVDSVLVVVTNTGDDAYPFDPDDDVWEPHAWMLTIASE